MKLVSPSSGLAAGLWVREEHRLQLLHGGANVKSQFVCEILVVPASNSKTNTTRQRPKEVRREFQSAAIHFRRQNP